MKQENIRNFSIIAHIDHGKSTLADRILEKTGALSAREMKDQFLDSMDLERERGITIKLNSVSLKYKYNNEEYLLNLIDTPGHVDFSYEVSRSLAACEGAILVVDATQGIEAQTLANLYLALEDNLTIIPVINKIDLPNANIPLVKESLIKTLGFKDEDIILCSGKTGEGVEDLLESVIKNIPAPQNHDSEPLSALVFDSYFDSYKGVVGLIKVEKGVLKVKDKIKFFTSNKEYEVVNIFKHNPKEEEVSTLRSGEVGYFVGSIKDLLEIKVGDTLTHIDNPCKERIKGYKEMKPMVYSGVFPIEPNKYDALKEAFDKLKLNDASLTIEKESSTSLGFGFRVGFLGLLHMDVIKERLEQEFGLNIIITSPSVIYKCYLTNKEVLEIDNPNLLPNMENIAKIEEPYIYTSILVPANYVGGIMTLCQNKRGIYKNIEYITSDRCNIHYEIPLGEIVYDFYDKLKSITEGYASFDYDLIGYKESKLVKLDIMLNGEKVDALSSIVHKDFAYERGRKITEKLRTIIPRGLFQINIQASIGSKVIARETLSPMKKNVLAKCYGGDISRKRKLLEKQKEGKKRMKMLGTVEVPSEAFIDILSE